MSEANKAVIRRFVEELWSQGNLDVADEIIHPNTRNPRGGATWANGPEGIKQLVASVRRSVPDMKRTVNDMVAEGNKVVLYSTISGTHTGEIGFYPYPPTGEQVSLTGVATFIIEDGKIIEEPWSNWDYSQALGPISKTFVRRYIEEALNKGNLDIIKETFSENAVSHTPNGDLHGYDEITEPVIIRRNAFPDLQVTIGEQVAEGDKVVTHLTFTGTHKGDYRGIPATGKRATWKQIAISRIEKGKIVESWRIPDRLGLRQQLGAS